MTKSLEQTESLENKTLNKLNKILSAENVQFVSDSDAAGFCFIGEKLRRDAWDELDHVFFENDIEYTVFELGHFDGLSGAENAFKELGLMSLENCSSWEEMLIRLEIMFPDVQNMIQ